MKLLVGALVLGMSALAACAAPSADSSDSSDSADTVINTETLYSFNCSSADTKTTLTVNPAFGGDSTLVAELTTDDGFTNFNCTSANASTITCNQLPLPGQQATVQIQVDITAHGRTASVTDTAGRANGSLKCTAGPGDKVTTIPSYTDVAPIVAGTCGTCHGDKFDSLDKIKSMRGQMASKIATGAMPRHSGIIIADQIKFLDTDDGKKLLAFLLRSPELN
jgi:hypothetical protein